MKHGLNTDHNSRFRISNGWLRIFLAGCCVAIVIHFAITVNRVGVKIGDYDVNREFGRRFLLHENLYEGGQCFNYMPASAVYWAPLALVPPRVGMALRYFTALACLGLTFQWLRFMTLSGQPRYSWTVALVSCVLALHYLIRDFDDGGPHAILLAILVGGVYCYWRRREKLGAFWLGLAIAVKISPGLLLPFLLWKRKWRFACLTGAATVFWLLLPAVWMGPASWWRHQSQWNKVVLSVARDSSDALREENEQRVQNQAFKPAVLRILLTYPPGHPNRLEQAGYIDFLNWPSTVASRVASALMLGLWCLLCWRTHRTWNVLAPAVILGEVSALLCLVLLFSPVTWLQHFVFALPAIYWIVAREQLAPRLLVRWLLGAYVVLALVMNRELLGRENYLLLLSYHTHTICLLLLFFLVLVGLSGRPDQIQVRSSNEMQGSRNQAA